MYNLLLLSAARPHTVGVSLSPEMVEVAMAALVGGQFKFPKNTVLIIACRLCHFHLRASPQTTEIRDATLHVFI